MTRNDLCPQKRKSLLGIFLFEKLIIENFLEIGNLDLEILAKRAIFLFFSQIPRRLMVQSSTPNATKDQ